MKKRQHGYEGYRRGCTCNVCVETYQDYQHRRKLRQREGLIPDSVVHGKYTTYSNWACRCDPCRKAWSEYSKKAREARYSKPIPDFVAHNKWTYLNWGCRCNVCVDDHNAQARAYRRAKQRASGLSQEER